MGSDKASPPPIGTPQRVLFVCTGNTCRSVFAEYLARACFGSGVHFESAGIAPQSAADAENAIHTLKQAYNIDASSHIPRGVQSLDLTRYDLIIALDKCVGDKLRGELDVAPSKLKLWKTQDPWGGDLSEYETCSLRIKRQVIQWRKSIGRGAQASLGSPMSPLDEG